jgi:hypothetical protein
MTNRLEQAVGLGEEIERQLGLDSVWVCADLFHRNMEGDDLAEALIDAGRGSPVRMSMTTKRRPYREVGQFGQVVGVVSPQPSTVQEAPAVTSATTSSSAGMRPRRPSPRSSTGWERRRTGPIVTRETTPPRPIHVPAVASQGWVTRDPGLADVWVGHGWRGG